MKIVGKLTARTLIYFGAVEMSFTILLCYVLAVTHHHVKPWLPTISACGEHAPEQYPFRFGILVGAMLLFVEAIALYAASITSRVTHILGVVASLCLGVVAVVAANEDNVVHTSELVVRNFAQSRLWPDRILDVKESGHARRGWNGES